MTQNPYQSPNAPLTNSTPDTEQIKKVAVAQRWLIGVIASFAIFGIVFFYYLGVTLQPDKSIFIIPILIIELFGLISVYRLANAMSLSGVLWVIGMLVPWLNLVCLFRLNSKATTFLESNGLKVGFFGAKGI